MYKQLTYNRYNLMPTKVRLTLLQTALQREGYKVSINGKRDRDTIKALRDFQSKNGITPNAIVCKKTFEVLKIEGDVNGNKHR